MSIRITSLQNPKIKHALSLRKASERKREGLFLIEGSREIRLAMLAGYEFHTLFISIPVEEKSSLSQIIDALTGQVQVIEIPEKIFGRLVYREGTVGILAIARQKGTGLSGIHLGRNPLLLVMESVEKPGNLGAVLRTADAAGIDAVLVCDGITDIYNPNVVRSSLGTLFTNQVVCCSTREAIGWLKSNNIKIYTTVLSASMPYHHADYTMPAAIVAGSEASGVTGIWQENSDAGIIIPMFGKVDSINVSAATSIVVYEALRQRGFPERGSIQDA